MTQRLLDIAGAAERLRTPVETLRYWRQIGKGPRSAKIGRRVMYREDEVEAWIGMQFDKAAG